MANFKTINIEEGMPTIEEARKKVIEILNTAKKEKILVIKLIHGYGSSGAGGGLKEALRKSLLKRRKEGIIKDFIIGEKWSIFNTETTLWLERCTFMRNDSDLNNNNPGITLIFL